ncbi:AEC family transporter [Ornithinimicrobium sp. Y1847]|uniref:AEC family transporter n=1 Tax=unclassified Ornithinimicrobium TaxID=2615080 RepID=UPI003B67B558
MLAVLQGFWLISVVVGVGWLIAHTKLFDRAGQQVLARLTFWVGSPALLFLVVARAETSVVFSGFLVATVAGIVVTSIVYLVLARSLLSRTWTQSVMGGMSVSYVNSNNLGVPIAIYVLGDASWAAPIVLLQLTILQPLWLAMLDSSQGGRVSWGRLLRAPFTNPLTVGSLLGLTVSLTGVRIPEMVEAPLELIGGMAIPGMLIVFGISLRLSPLPRGRDSLLDMGIVAALKLVLMPAVVWLVAGPILGLAAHEVLAAVVMATLPTAQNVYLLAVAYGRGEAVARNAVFLTTVLAMPAMLVVVALMGG